MTKIRTSKSAIKNTLLRLHLPDFTRVFITLAGCGGTGSHIASGLAPIALALHERGVTCDLRFVDPDVVERKNVGRQLFATADIGKPKAAVLANRLNAAYGLRVESLAEPLSSIVVRQDAPSPRESPWVNVVIGAVDNAKARALIAKFVTVADGRLWWLDAGNERETGQVGLGNVPAGQVGRPQLGLVDRLPMPSAVHPDLIIPSPARRRGRAVASCAGALAAGEQSLVVNRMAAAWALSMLHDFLVTHSLAYFSVSFNLRWGAAQAIAIDAKTLKQYA